MRLRYPTVLSSNGQIRFQSPAGNVLPQFQPASASRLLDQMACDMACATADFRPAKRGYAEATVNCWGTCYIDDIAGAEIGGMRHLAVLRHRARIARRRVGQHHRGE